MHLVSVKNHSGFVCNCLRCEKRIEGMEPRYADTQGPAFLAYYCPTCAEILRPGSTINPVDGDGNPIGDAQCQKKC